ncbi:polysaccharide biosynthesis/export family protein [Bosea sp. UC22_33]|uniref:polysaccharide biosynthesis/export family protein n=1 Tax=Bosea sp. UC22_33 TaxID=3350165 RepID=UPI003671FA13
MGHPSARKSWATALLMAGMTLLWAQGACRAEYLLAPGDVVEIAVAAMPELRQRIPVQPDGTIIIPMLGAVTAAGSTPSALQDRVETAFAAKILRQRMPDGRERIVLIQPGDVTTAVVEYRPIYVSGDVLNPGQYVYRPQMTARHAIALSGGPSTVRGRPGSSGVDIAEAEREYRATTSALAKEHVVSWRLVAELDGSETIKQQPLGHLSVSAATLADFLRVETRYLQVRLTEAKSERAYLESTVRQAGEQIATLTTQVQGEQSGLQADMEELDRVNKLFGIGSLPSPRVTDSRRAVLLSSTRRLQTIANLTQVKQQRDELLWRLDKVDIQRRLDVLRESRESQLRMTELKARLDGAVEKLRVLGQMAVLEFERQRHAAGRHDHPQKPNELGSYSRVRGHRASAGRHRRSHVPT